MTQPAKSLASKVSRSKVSASDLEVRLAAAEAQVAAVADGFTEWVAEDLAVAQAEVAKLEKGEGDEESVKTIFRVVHDIKGQGSTFGYNLATTVAAPLCDFIRTATKKPTADQINVIKGHLMVLDVVIRKNIKGDGDDTVREIVDKLTRATARVPPLS